MRFKKKKIFHFNKNRINNLKMLYLIIEINYKIKK